MGSPETSVSSGLFGSNSMLVASFGNGRSFLSTTALYCTLVALPCAGATVMNTPRANGPFLSEIVRWFESEDTEVRGATYFCHPSAASALSTVSAVCVTGLSVVKMVLAGLANTSLAPGTRGSLLVLSVLSDCGSDFEQPASVKTLINAASKMRARAPVLSRMIVLSFFWLVPNDASGASIVGRVPTAVIAAAAMLINERDNAAT